MSRTSKNGSFVIEDNCSTVTINPTTNNSKTLHEPVNGTRMNVDAISSNSPSTTSTHKNTTAQQRNMHSGVPQALVPPARPTLKPRTPASEIIRPRQINDSVQKEQGPWSREAFDLFDWRPGVRNTAAVT
jgi:hypothetical protein